LSPGTAPKFGLLSLGLAAGGLTVLVMQVAGYILVIIGVITCLIGEIRMLVLAYRRGFIWLLSCLLCAPFCWFALLAVDFKSTIKPFTLAVVGLIAAWAGGLMAGIEY
jgi:hypothetical protein